MEDAHSVLRSVLTARSGYETVETSNGMASPCGAPIAAPLDSAVGGSSSVITVTRGCTAGSGQTAGASKAPLRAPAEAPHAGSRGELAGGHLADLIARESRVESLREWLLNTPTLLCFGLYVSLGLGSWVSRVMFHNRRSDESLY